MFLSDTALWNSHRILPLDIVKNQLLTQYIPVYSFLLEWNIEVKEIHLVPKGNSCPVLFKVGHQLDKWLRKVVLLGSLEGRGPATPYIEAPSIRKPKNF